MSRLPCTFQTRLLQQSIIWPPLYPHKSVATRTKLGCAFCIEPTPICPRINSMYLCLGYIWDIYRASFDTWKENVIANTKSVLKWQQINKTIIKTYNRLINVTLELLTHFPSQSRCLLLHFCCKFIFEFIFIFNVYF